MGLHHQNFNALFHSREHLVKYTPTSADQLPPRSMQDSFSSAIIPLSTDIALREKYIGFLRHLRLGRLLEDMDLFAVWIVQQHIYVPDLDHSIPLPYTFVTILVDKIVFTEMDPEHDCDIKLSGHVSWVGKSSIEVIVWLEQQKKDVWIKLTRAIFLMAARDPTNTRAAIVNTLVPRNEEEKSILHAGEKRKENRQNIQNFDLLKMEPSAHETKLIHDIFIKSIDTQSKAFNKRILPPGFVWMENASLTTIIFSHPEDRNNHNKVFGGFLMRHGLELSFALAYSFSHTLPKLQQVSDVSFIKPVDISSFMNMTAHVLYTESNMMEIVVIAETTDQISRKQITTDSFYYIYSVPEQLPKMMPNTYHEAMWYLDGHRKFKKMSQEHTEEPKF